jgi:cytidine deaminase
MQAEQQPITMQPLIDAALAVAEHAYAPYSRFRVGAALLLTNGEMITGANVENVSYGLTICAERSALVSAIAEFGPEIRIAAAAVVNLNGAPSPPCGACRQVLAEFLDGDAPLSFPAATATGVAQTTVPFRELLPYGFDLQLK